MIVWETPYGFICFHASKHTVPYLETHEKPGSHGFMYESRYNCVFHKVPCVEKHGNLLNSDQRFQQSKLVQVVIMRILSFDFSGEHWNLKELTVFLFFASESATTLFTVLLRSVLPRSAIFRAFHGF